MMRYVIVCLLKGQVLDFHEAIVNQVCKKFDVRRQRLPAHFTIKAPFETDNIKEIEKLTEEFCSKNVKTSLKIEGFGHFRDNVIFMDIHPSRDAFKVHDKYIDELKKLSWLEWKQNEGENKKFHCTIVSKRIREKFNDIWKYVLNYEANFETYFDNISILIWRNYRWETYREYKLS